MRMLLTTILFSFPFKIAFAFISSLAISVYGHRKKSLSAGGAVAAIAVGFTLTLANYCFFACLLVFFVSSSFWTKWRSARKKKLEADFKEGTYRHLFLSYSDTIIRYKPRYSCHQEMLKPEATLKIIQNLAL